MTNLEWVGYIGSVLIVGSFLIANNFRLTRCVNGFGCIAMVIYGFSIQSYPVVIPNVFLLMVQIYYLFIKKETGSKEDNNII